MTNSEILIYQSPGGVIKIDVHLEDESVWLTQTQMGQLFAKGRPPVRTRFYLVRSIQAGYACIYF
jgi:hypothetical protein